jgi:hypothetical protein
MKGKERLRGCHRTEGTTDMITNTTWYSALNHEMKTSRKSSRDQVKSII